MKKTRYTAPQIIGKLREAEVVSAKGGTIGLVCKQIGVTESAKSSPWNHDLAKLIFKVIQGIWDRKGLFTLAKWRAPGGGRTGMPGADNHFTLAVDRLIFSGDTPVG